MGKLRDLLIAQLNRAQVRKIICNTWALGSKLSPNITEKIIYFNPSNEIFSSIKSGAMSFVALRIYESIDHEEN